MFPQLPAGGFRHGSASCDRPRESALRTNQRPGRVERVSSARGTPVGGSLSARRRCRPVESGRHHRRATAVARGDRPRSQRSRDPVLYGDSDSSNAVPEPPGGFSGSAVLVFSSRAANLIAAVLQVGQLSDADRPISPRPSGRASRGGSLRRSAETSGQHGNRAGVPTIRATVTETTTGTG